MCLVFIWEQTATCATYAINWLVFITEMKSVYSAVRTGSLNKAVWVSWLKDTPLIDWTLEDSFYFSIMTITNLSLFFWSTLSCIPPMYICTETAVVRPVDGGDNDTVDRCCHIAVILWPMSAKSKLLSLTYVKMWLSLEYSYGQLHD